MKVTPKEFVLMHIDPNYDAQKAHDYYIRTRKLKGRKKGVKLTGDLANEKTNTVVRPELRGKFIPKGTPKAGLITTERQAQVEARVQALKGKLLILEALLKKLVSDVQGSSTTKRTKLATPGSKKSAATSPRKALTSSQKSDKAKKAKAAYKKAHPNSASEKRKKIREVKAQIEQVKAELKAALERAKSSIAKPTGSR